MTTTMGVLVAPVPPVRTPLAVAGGAVKAMRPRQWLKNVLVFAATFVGGHLLTRGIVANLLVAFVAFSLAASGIYVVGDVKDVAADRSHPTERLRPIAGGIVSPPVATGIPLSRWFLLVAGFGSLFTVAGKRYAEMMLAQRTGAKIRRALEHYTASYLRFVWALSATVAIMTYCLWAFDIGQAQHNPTWSVISIVPFVIAMLRYAVDVDRGNGGEPEEIALGDRVLQVLALAWVGTLALAVYGW